MTQSLSNVFNAKFASKVVEIVEPHLCQQTSQGPNQLNIQANLVHWKQQMPPQQNLWAVGCIHNVYISYAICLNFWANKPNQRQVPSNWQSTPRSLIKTKAEVPSISPIGYGITMAMGNNTPVSYKFFGANKTVRRTWNNTPSGHISMAEP